MSRVLFLIIFFMSAPFNSAADILVPTVVIDQKYYEAQEPVDSYSIFKLEKVSKGKINQPSRQNLSEIVKDQVGVDSQTYCANCGAKRLSVNGLKGEHTSILIDGLPLHSAVSSFYGVDNIPANGISEIQVMRGAGASLANPEAIGGTLNLVTVDPLNFKNTYSLSTSVDDDISSKSQNYSFLYGLKREDKKLGVIAGGQFAEVKPWDVDENKISESPQRQNYSFMTKARYLLGRKNDFSVRLGKSNLEILGGYYRPTKPKQVRVNAAQESDFVGGSVENKFIGDPAKVTDWVELDRTEAAASGVHYLKRNLTYEWKLGYARQEQKTIYQHGFDYANTDNLFVGDTNLKFFLGSKSVYSIGAFFKDQRLRSASYALFERYPSTDPRDIKKDSFNLSSYAAYVQYSYYLPDLLEFDLALRADRLEINWLELANQIKKPVWAPRLQVLHHLNDHLKQRLSYGLGYRAPLTFFESQHGNNESGYEVDITKLEKSHSFVYSLSWNTPKYYLTAGAHYTYLKNMAYGFETFNKPILYRNSNESYKVWVVDFLAGYKPSDWWFVEASAEFFDYEDGYKRRLPTAAIEQRYQLKSSFNRGNWSHSVLFNLVGSRDLSKYGSYNHHYVNRNQSAEPSLDPNLTLKKQKAPMFFTLDTFLTYKLSKSFSFNFGVKNILDYTQAGEGDSPATWHWHFNHAHYDGLHNWGPNTGREYFFSLSGEI